MPERIGKAVFVVHYFEPLTNTVLPLCRMLQQSSQLAPFIILEGDADQRMRKLCEAAGVPYLADDAPARSGGSAAPKKDISAPPPNGLRQALGGIGRTLRIPSLVRKVGVQIRRLQDKLSNLQPAIMILLDDRTLLTCAWCRAAQQLDVPVMVVQWAATYTASTMLEVRALNEKQQNATLLPGIAGWITANVPGAARRHGKQNIWWLPPEQSLAYWFNSAYPKANPWSFGGGNADAVTVFGNVWKRRLVHDGVPEQKIVVTGHPAQDTWFELARNWTEQDRMAVLASLDISPEHKIVTVVSPALSFRESGGYRQGDISLADLRSELADVVAAIQRLGKPYFAVVKKHPRDSMDHLKFLADRQPVKIVGDVDIHRLIAASSAMACQWSTTAMLGQALNVPVLVFDFHGSPSAQMWQGAVGLEHADSIPEFEKRLRQCLCDPAARQILAQKRQQFVDDYLCLDGKAQDRLVTLIDALASRRSPCRAA